MSEKLFTGAGFAVSASACVLSGFLTSIPVLANIRYAEAHAEFSRMCERNWEKEERRERLRRETEERQKAKIELQDQEDALQTQTEEQAA
jgi:hypothetical protein